MPVSVFLLVVSLARADLAAPQSSRPDPDLTSCNIREEMVGCGASYRGKVVANCEPYRVPSPDVRFLKLHVEEVATIELYCVKKGTALSPKPKPPDDPAAGVATTPEVAPPPDVLVEVEVEVDDVRERRCATVGEAGYVAAGLVLLVAAARRRSPDPVARGV